MQRCETYFLKNIEIPDLFRYQKIVQQEQSSNSRVLSSNSLYKYIKLKTYLIGSRIHYKFNKTFSKNSSSGGFEASPDFYDLVYENHSEYDKHFSNSRYYFVWTVILDRILRSSGRSRVLEIGCGRGQFAQMLLHYGVEKYTGFDFSSSAIALINRSSFKNAEFYVGDAHTDQNVLKANSEFDAVICTEVLEHVTEDLNILNRIPEGTRFIGTVPNFPYQNHVRHFKDAESVKSRYSSLFNNFSVIGLAQPNPSKDVYWLFEGVRNNTKLD